MKTIEVLLAGKKTSETKNWLNDIPRLSVSECHVESELASWLNKPDYQPQLLVLELEENGIELLDYLSGVPVSRRPTLLVTLEGENSEVLRHAMQAGARDYLVHPFTEDDFKTSVQKLLQDFFSKENNAPGHVISMIGATSEISSAFLAANLAHVMTLVGRRKTVVVDLDMQFSALPLFLDLTIERSLSQVIEAGDSIDEIAIDAYMSKHKSGLHVLGSAIDDIVLPGELDVEHIQKIIKMISQVYDRVYINLPRLIDPLTTTMIEDSEETLIVVDQNIAGLKYAKGLLNILKNELGLPQNKLTLLVNQYLEKQAVTKQDIEKTLSCKSSFIIPADWKNVLESENAGIPLYDLDKSSPTTKALIELAEKQSGEHFVAQKSIINRLITKLSSR